MIAQEKTDRVIALLAAGELSNRQIAKAVGVSHWFVNQTASGNLPECDRDTEVEDERPPTVLRSAVPRRCACGAKVYGECLTCKLRAGEAQKGDKVA